MHIDAIYPTIGTRPPPVPEYFLIEMYSRTLWLTDFMFGMECHGSNEEEPDDPFSDFCHGSTCTVIETEEILSVSPARHRELESTIFLNRPTSAPDSLLRPIRLQWTGLSMVTDIQ